MAATNQNRLSFGAMVACYRGDLPLLRGCLSSIKATFPNIPICLVTHGSLEIEDLVRQYDLSVLTEADVSPVLKEYSYGYGLTKMVSFWHSPFERFVHFDADTVCWGNFLSDVDIEEYDFIFNEPHEIIDDFIQRTQYFDPKIVEPGFEWKACPFFNSGVFVARRGIFSLDEYIDLLKIQRQHPSALFGDQGPLNILLFRGVAQNNIRAKYLPLQAVIPVLSVERLKFDYKLSGSGPVVEQNNQRLLHWAGRKPLLTERHPFTEPMTYFRLKHLKDGGSPRYYLGRVGLVIEEIDSRFTAKHGGSYIKAAKSKLKYLLSQKYSAACCGF